MLSGHRTRQISENLVVLTKEEWKTMSMGTSKTKDTSQSGTVEFKIIKLSGNNLVSKKLKYLGFVLEGWN